MRSLAALGLALFLSGCGSSPATQFYTLAPVPSQAPMRPMSGTLLQVEAVHIPPALDRQEMVRESGPNKLDVSDQNRWGAPFDEMTRRVLTQDLTERLPKGVVVLPEEPAPPQADKIVVDILQFDCDPSGKVIFDGSWSLLRNGSEKAVMSRHVQLSESADPGNYGSQARAMSRILGELADDIAMTSGP